MRPSACPPVTPARLSAPARGLPPASPAQAAAPLPREGPTPPPRQGPSDLRWHLTSSGPPSASRPTFRKLLSLPRAAAGVFASVARSSCSVSRLREPSRLSKPSARGERAGRSLCEGFACSAAPRGVSRVVAPGRTFGGRRGGQPMPSEESSPRGSRPCPCPGPLFFPLMFITLLPTPGSGSQVTPRTGEVFCLAQVFLRPAPGNDKSEMQRLTLP